MIHTRESPNSPKIAAFLLLEKRVNPPSLSSERSSATDLTYSCCSIGVATDSRTDETSDMAHSTIEISASKTSVTGVGNGATVSEGVPSVGVIRSETPVSGVIDCTSCI